MSTPLHKSALEQKSAESATVVAAVEVRTQTREASEFAGQPAERPRDHRDLAADMAAVRAVVLRRRHPLPTETIALDLGEFGCEIEAVVTYEVNPADILGSGERVRAYLSIYSIVIDKLGEVTDFVKAQHPDALQGIVEKVEAKLEARFGDDAA